MEVSKAGKRTNLAASKSCLWGKRRILLLGFIIFGWKWPLMWQNPEETTALLYCLDLCSLLALLSLKIMTVWHFSTCQWCKDSTLWCLLGMLRAAVSQFQQCNGAYIFIACSIALKTWTVFESQASLVLLPSHESFPLFLFLLWPPFILYPLYNIKH